MVRKVRKRRKAKNLKKRKTSRQIYDKGKVTIPFSPFRTMALVVVLHLLPFISLKKHLRRIFSQARVYGIEYQGNENDPYTVFKVLKKEKKRVRKKDEVRSPRGRQLRGLPNAINVGRPAPSIGPIENSYRRHAIYPHSRKQPHSTPPIPCRPKGRSSSL